MIKHATLDELNHALMEIYHELNVKDQERRASGEAWVRAESSYRLAAAKVVIEIVSGSSRTSADYRQAMVDLKCEKERVIMEMAKVKFDADKDRTHTLRSELSALQSMMKTAQMELAMVNAAPNGVRNMPYQKITQEPTPVLTEGRWAVTMGETSSASRKLIPTNFPAFGTSLDDEDIEF